MPVHASVIRNSQPTSHLRIQDAATGSRTLMTRSHVFLLVPLATAIPARSTGSPPRIMKRSHPQTLRSSQKLTLVMEMQELAVLTLILTAGTLTTSAHVDLDTAMITLSVKNIKYPVHVYKQDSKRGAGFAHLHCLEFQIFISISAICPGSRKIRDRTHIKKSPSYQSPAVGKSCRANRDIYGPDWWPVCRLISAVINSL